MAPWVTSLSQSEGTNPCTIDPTRINRTARNRKRPAGTQDAIANDPG